MRHIGVFEHLVTTPSPATAGRIHVVDDEPDIAALVAFHLARAGYLVSTAGTGPDAVRIAREERPSLVVLDLMLPGMSGYHVLELLRRDAATSGIAVLMLTARRDEEDRVRGLSLGADDYVTKPFSPRELVLRVGAILRRARGEGSAHVTVLPGKSGEVYAHVTNGPGYAASETDRFKDVGVRLSLTPLATHPGLFQTLAITPWVYRGRTGSKFAAGGVGQVAPVTDGLPRKRWGIFVGSRDPRLTLGMQYAKRTDGYEYGSNTAIAPRTVSDTMGTLLSMYVLARPLRWQSGNNVSRLGMVLRRDEFRTHGALPGREQLWIVGLEYAPTPRTALAVDFQELQARDYVGRAPITDSRTVYVHWAAAF
jgi:DNA-binding response OmpR family regulator